MIPLCKAPFEKQLATAAECRRVAGPHARAILTDTPQGRFLVPVEDLFVGMELRMNGSFSPMELNHLRRICSGQTRLLVVGANIGALAIPLAKVCRSVVAIEADPRTFELLSLNVALNGVQNMRLVHVAASNRSEEIDFLLGVANPGGSKRKPIGDDPAFTYDNPQVVKVQAAALDELLAGEVFDVVLMDIEGSEYFALQGMQRILASVQTMQIEFFPLHLRKVAGISAAQFVDLISPHFATLAIPAARLKVGREQFLPVLSGMFDRDEGDHGIYFTKIPPEAISFLEPASRNPPGDEPPRLLPRDPD